MVWNKESPITALTGPHKLLHAFLRDSRVGMGFRVEDEVEVGKYRLDCFVRELWIGFECDGKRIHAGVTKQKKDEARDAWVSENAGIPIMRIQADALQFTQWEKLKPIVLAFVEEHADTVEERKAIGKDLVG